MPAAPTRAPAAPEDIPIAPNSRSLKRRALIVAALLLLTRRWIVYHRHRRECRCHPVACGHSVPEPSGDPAQDYLADGITELLTTELGRALPVRVTSRTSAMKFARPAEPCRQSPEN